MNMNRQMKLPEIQKIMQEFEKQSEIMDMKEEMMNDVIGEENVFLLIRAGKPEPPFFERSRNWSRIEKK